ncbi:MAG: hypothetical protein ABJN34_00060 [Litoreibacter sp.]|uniref:hypothetical protein n=1 Tax=Litoreibacter sp. TaxID=1969459 RepID=UPI003297363F
MLNTQTSLDFTGVEKASLRPVYLSDYPKSSQAFLNHLRLTARECRSAAHTDLFTACAVLSVSAPVSRNAHAQVLMKCLAQALGKTPLMYRPDVEEVSFDEAWLIRTGEAAASKDWDSFEFLIRSRVPKISRRNVGALLVSISDQFALT